jgi:hypothetical protein
VAFSIMMIFQSKLLTVCLPDGNHYKLINIMFLFIYFFIIIFFFLGGVVILWKTMLILVEHLDSGFNSILTIACDDWDMNGYLTILNQPCDSLGCSKKEDAP